MPTTSNATDKFANTFILIAPDSSATEGKEPPVKADKKTVAAIEFELLHNHPYHYTQEELWFETHVRHRQVDAEQLQTSRQELWDVFFEKSHACIRASALTKTYGWGVHYDAEGKMALYGCDSPEYQKFIKDPNVTVLNAMRSKREK